MAMRQQRWVEEGEGFWDGGGEVRPSLWVDEILRWVDYFLFGLWVRDDGALQGWPAVARATSLVPAKSLQRYHRHRQCKQR
jgi:hypothetical protein